MAFEDRYDQEECSEIELVYSRLNVAEHLRLRLMVYRVTYDNCNHQDRMRNHILAVSLS